MQGHSEYNVITDHRPLVAILDKKRLDEIDSPRLQRMKEKLSSYKFSTLWTNGKKYVIPDALSRAPIEFPDVEDDEAEEDVEEYVKRTRVGAVNVITEKII